MEKIEVDPGEDEEEARHAIPGGMYFFSVFFFVYFLLFFFSHRLFFFVFFFLNPTYISPSLIKSLELSYFNLDYLVYNHGENNNCSENKVFHSQIYNLVLARSRIVMTTIGSLQSIAYMTPNKLSRGHPEQDGNA